MKGVRFHDSKLKLVKALLFRSFHETEAPTAGFCSPFICGRAYWARKCNQESSDISHNESSTFPRVQCTISKDSLD